MSTVEAAESVVMVALGKYPDSRPRISERWLGENWGAVKAYVVCEGRSTRASLRFSLH